MQRFTRRCRPPKMVYQDLIDADSIDLLFLEDRIKNMSILKCHPHCRSLPRQVSIKVLTVGVLACQEHLLLDRSKVLGTPHQVSYSSPSSVV